MAKKTVFKDTDEKGVKMKLEHDASSGEYTVTVSYKKLSKVETFAQSTALFHDPDIDDLVKAEKIAEKLGAQIDREFGI